MPRPWSMGSPEAPWAWPRMRPWRPRSAGHGPGSPLSGPRRAGGSCSCPRDPGRPGGAGAGGAAARGGAGAQPAGPEALEILRIEAGQPRLYADLDETVLPAEVGLDAAISTTKGCYTGQEIVARMASQGRAKHRLVGLALAGESSPAPGEAIRDAEGAVGEITSACLSPVFGAIALGFVGAARAAPGTCLEVAGHPARVAALPFAAAAR